MITCFLLLTLELQTAGQHAQHTQASRITVAVDPRVELMSIIFRLAGNSEYNQPNSKSPYADEVDAHFGPFRGHDAVKLARGLRALRGVSFDAVMSMAMHISDARLLEERIPFDKNPERLDQRWKPAEAREFLTKARDFVRKTGFTKFIYDHREFYDKSAARLREQIDKRDYVKWFDTFFGARSTAKFHAIAGLLNGGGNYGVGIRFPDGTEEITPVIGIHQFDDTGLPVVSESIAGLVVHELCHSYTNRIVDKFAEALQPAGQRIYKRCAAVMKRQAYGNWKTVLYESLVRACTVRYTIQNDGPEAGENRVKYEHSRGFVWVGKLAELLSEYETARDRYPALEAFMPRVVTFFNEYADEHDRLAAAAQVDPVARAHDTAAEAIKARANAPKVLSMTPANGAADVDPGITEIKITFDRPMADRSWSIVGGGPNFPQINGKLSYDGDKKVLTIPVRLKPDWTYRFWLNSPSYKAFRSTAGDPLEPVSVSFKTRAK